MRRPGPFKDLAQQASDPNSGVVPLKKGRFTSAATGATVSIAAKSALALSANAFRFRQSQQGGGGDARAKLLAPFGGEGGSLTGCPPGSPTAAGEAYAVYCLPKGLAGLVCNSPKVIVVKKSYAAQNAAVSEMVHAGQVCAWSRRALVAGFLSWPTRANSCGSLQALPPRFRSSPILILAYRRLSALDRPAVSLVSTNMNRPVPLLVVSTQRHRARERGRA